MRVKDRLLEYDKELARLKLVMPGLQCSSMMMHRGQPTIAVGYVDDSSTTFAMDTTIENASILASRLLDGHITLMNRLHKNYEALKEIVNAQ